MFVPSIHPVHATGGAFNHTREFTSFPNKTILEVSPQRHTVFIKTLQNDMAIYIFEGEPEAQGLLKL